MTAEHAAAEVVGHLIRDAGGSPVGCAKVLRDLDADLHRTSNAFYALLELAPDAMFIVGPDGRIMLANAQAGRLFGYAREDLLGREIEMLLPYRFRGNHVQHRADYFAQPNVRQMGAGLNLFAARRDGTEFPVQVSLGPLRIGETQYVSATIADVTELHSARQAEARLATVVQSSDDAIISMTAGGVIETCNPGADRLLGHPVSGIVGQPVRSLMPSAAREMFDNALDEIRGGGRAEPYGTQWLRADATLIDVTVNVFALRNASDGIIGFSAIARDISAQVEAQRQLERLAHIDTLTGLVNRAETIRRLESAVDCSRTPGTELGVLFCDVDHFKAVNDTWGHAVGDVVLAAVADRIRECVRHGDTVGRTGGDEMLVLLPNVHDLAEVEQIAKKIRWCVAAPIRYSGTTIHVTLSVGATLAVRGESVSTMTARADAAMYQAKKAGRDATACI